MKSWSLWNCVGYRLGVANKFAGANTALLPIAVFQMDELENGSKNRSRQFADADTEDVSSTVSAVTGEGEARNALVDKTSINFAACAILITYPASTVVCMHAHEELL